MPETSVDEWFDSLSDEQCALLSELRSLVLSVHEKIVEEIKWNQPCYKLNRHICYLNKNKSNVVIGFQQGAHLSDPKRLLEGNGKDMRRVKVYSNSDIKKRYFKALIKEAIKIDKAMA